MELVRLGGSSFTRQEYSVTKNTTGGKVEVRFLGPERTSDFRVDISWDDVEKLVIEFVAMKEPKAVQFQQAKSLATAARREGWSPGD